LPSRTATSFAAMTSMCQPIAKRVRGFSSRKQRCAKLTKSRRSSAVFAPVLAIAQLQDRSLQPDHAYRLRPLSRCWRSRMSCDQVRWMNESTAQMSASLRLPLYAGISVW